MSLRFQLVRRPDGTGNAEGFEDLLIFNDGRRIADANADVSVGFLIEWASEARGYGQTFIPIDNYYETTNIELGEVGLIGRVEAHSNVDGNWHKASGMAKAFSDWRDRRDVATDAYFIQVVRSVTIHYTDFAGARRDVSWAVESPFTYNLDNGYSIDTFNVSDLDSDPGRIDLDVDDSQDLIDQWLGSHYQPWVAYAIQTAFAGTPEADEQP